MKQAPIRQGFTIIEIMIVVAITGIILMTGVGTWMRQREISRARACQENLSKIEGAKEQYALENRLDGLATPTWADLVGPTSYLKSTPHCPGGADITINIIDADPLCAYVLPDFLSNEKFAHEIRD